MSGRNSRRSGAAMSRPGTNNHNRETPMKRVLLAAAAGLSACGQVTPGHVGIKVNQFGSGAGVSNEVLGVGTYLTLYGTHIEEYPVFTNTYTYTASGTEGS